MLKNQNLTIDEFIALPDTHFMFEFNQKGEISKMSLHYITKTDHPYWGIQRQLNHYLNLTYSLTSDTKDEDGTESMRKLFIGLLYLKVGDSVNVLEKHQEAINKFLKIPSSTFDHTPTATTYSK